MRVNKLFLIKLIHTIIFIFISACLLYILYCGITKTYNLALLLAIGAIFIEGLALLLNQWRCPLTTLAEKSGAEKGSVTEMFYPKWFVPHTFRFSTALFIIGLVLLAFRYFVK